MPQNFIGQAGVVFETSCGVGDVVLRFDDGLAGIAAFQFGKGRGVRANFLRQLIEKAATISGGGLSPGAGIEGGARGFYSAIDIGCRSRGHMGDHFLSRRIIDGKHFARRALNPLTVDIVLIGSNDRFRSTGHNCLQIQFIGLGRALLPAFAQPCACRR